jgi:hypothetical protein
LVNGRSGLWRGGKDWVVRDIVACDSDFGIKLSVDDSYQCTEYSSGGSSKSESRDQRNHLIDMLPPFGLGKIIPKVISIIFLDSLCNIIQLVTDKMILTLVIVSNL